LVQVPHLPAEVRDAVSRLPRGAPRSRQRANNIQHVIDQIVKGLV
jgi:hypothetical protein